MWISGLVLLCCGIVLGSAAPQGHVEGAEITPVPIVSQAEEFEPNGAYKFSYESGNGIKVEESSFSKLVPFVRTAENANLKDAPENEEVHVQQGSYSYTAPDGTLISLKYIADENGFQPIGDHIPTSPPVPEAIARSLALQAGNQDVESIQAPSQAASNVVEKIADTPAAAIPDIDIITNA